VEAKREKEVALDALKRECEVRVSVSVSVKQEKEVALDALKRECEVC
jgi:hypothetical protein